MPTDIALSLGKCLKNRVEKKRSKEASADIQLVLDEAPQTLDEMADRLIARAATIRSDRDGFRMIDDDLVVHVPALPHGTLEEMQAECEGIKRIESDTSTTEAVTLRLVTVLKSMEMNGIDGATYERRITRLRTGGKILGFSHRKWLVANQDNATAIPDANVRAALKRILRMAYIDFSGTIVVSEDGYHCIPYAVHDGGRWCGSWSRLRHDFDGHGRIAVSVSS